MATQNTVREFFYSKDDKRIKESQYKELSKVEHKRVFEYFEQEFGVNFENLKEYLFLKRGYDIWVTSKSAKSMLQYQKRGLTISSIGIRAIRKAFERNPKITSNFAIILNENITKNNYELSRQELELYLHGYDVELSESKNKEYNRYVALKHNNKIFGVGLVIENKIKNQLPKGRVLRNQITQMEEE